MSRRTFGPLCRGARCEIVPAPGAKVPPARVAETILRGVYQKGRELAANRGMPTPAQDRAKRNDVRPTPSEHEERKWTRLTAANVDVTMEVVNNYQEPKES